MKQKIISFLIKMQFHAASGTLNGLKDFTINTVQFRFRPGLDDETASGLFSYLLDLCERVDDTVTAGISVNIAAYLVDHKIPFKARFKYDKNMTLRSNIRWLKFYFKFKSMLRAMRISVLANPSDKWAPACEVALFKFDDMIARKEGKTA